MHTLGDTLCSVHTQCGQLSTGACIYFLMTSRLSDWTAFQILVCAFSWDVYGHWAVSACIYKMHGNEFNYQMVYAVECSIKSLTLSFKLYVNDFMLDSTIQCNSLPDCTSIAGAYIHICMCLWWHLMNILVCTQCALAWVCNMHTLHTYTEYVIQLYNSSTHHTHVRPSSSAPHPSVPYTVQWPQHSTVLYTQQNKMMDHKQSPEKLPIYGKVLSMSDSCRQSRSGTWWGEKGRHHQGVVYRVRSMWEVKYVGILYWVCGVYRVGGEGMVGGAVWSGKREG